MVKVRDSQLRVFRFFSGGFIWPHVLVYRTAALGVMVTKLFFILTLTELLSLSQKRYSEEIAKSLSGELDKGYTLEFHLWHNMVEALWHPAGLNWNLDSASCLSWDPGTFFGRPQSQHPHLEADDTIS